MSKLCLTKLFATKSRPTAISATPATKAKVDVAKCHQVVCERREGAGEREADADERDRESKQEPQTKMWGIIE